MSTFPITISGKAYNAGADPNATSVPAEEGWPTPTFKARGKGFTYTYEVDRRMAELIESHLRELGGTFVVGEDDYTRAEGRALLKAADGIAAQIRAQS